MPPDTESIIPLTEESKTKEKIISPREKFLQKCAFQYFLKFGKKWHHAGIGFLLKKFGVFDMTTLIEIKKIVFSSLVEEDENDVNIENELVIA
jgi:hypothetical protein